MVQLMPGLFRGGRSPGREGALDAQGSEATTDETPKDRRRDAPTSALPPLAKTT